MYDGFPDGAAEGYAIDRERLRDLQLNSIDMPSNLAEAYGEPIGEEIKDKIKTENQYSIGSCQGQSLTSVMELCALIAGHPLQLSRWYAYRKSQQEDGIFGDRGSTISGGVAIAKRDGVCLESLCPYPDRYTSSINPKGTASESVLAENASLFKIKSSIRIDSLATADEFINKGLGGLHVGVAWNREFNPKVIESYTGRGAGGGHAWAILGRGPLVCPETNMRSFLMLNSWGEDWTNSDRGWKEIMPKALRQIIAHNRTAIVGLSDMAESDIITRSFDWLKHGISSQL